jgi:hypothetical protein
MASILPNGKTQFVDQNGKPLAGGTVTFYAPGTTTKQDTWQDQAMTHPNTNPVVLDSRGQATIWGDGSYRQVLADAFGVVIWDQVVAAPLTQSDLPSGGIARPSSPKLWQVWIDSTLGPYGQPIYCAQVTPSIIWCNFAGVPV